MPDKHSQMKGGGGGSGKRKSEWEGTIRAGLPTRKAVRKERRVKARQPRRWTVPDRNKK